VSLPVSGVVSVGCVGAARGSRVRTSSDQGRV